MNRLTEVVVVAVMLAALAGWAEAQSSTGPATIATLRILVPPVDHVGADAQDRRTPDQGMNLVEGDRVITGLGGVALVTFLDGSTVIIEPESAVVIRQVETRKDESSMRLLILIGKVWARIAQQLGRRTNLSLESNAYTATAHDGLIGAERRKDGTFVCWTRRGDVTVRDASGASVGVLAAGRKLTAVLPQEPRVETFQVHDSTLEIVASQSILPLIRMPDGYRVAGWTTSGVEVNQVFGSLTSAGAETRVIEVPGGRPGPYTVTLVGVTDGPFEVMLLGRYQGGVVYRHRMTGRIQRGEEWRTHIHPHFKEESGRDSTTSRLMGAVIEPLRRSSGVQAPDAVTLSPLR